MSILEWHLRTLKEKLKPAEQLQSWRYMRMYKDDPLNVMWTRNDIPALLIGVSIGLAIIFGGPLID